MCVVCWSKSVDHIGEERRRRIHEEQSFPKRKQRPPKSKMSKYLYGPYYNSTIDATLFIFVLSHKIYLIFLYENSLILTILLTIH